MRPDTTPEGGQGSGSGNTPPSLKHITVNLIGEDGNVFNLIGVCKRTVRREGTTDEQQWFDKVVLPRIMEARSYDEALTVMTETFDVQ